MSAADREARILESWHRNADAWCEAVREDRIRSRREVTDQAIVEAVLEHAPERVLDIGCGEGWLARRLAAQGVDVLGVDAVPALVDQARAAGGGDFRRIEYAALDDLLADAPFDVAVCNFSLFGDLSTRAVFRSIPGLIGRGGRFIVQTLAPEGAGPGAGEGWRPGSWEGFGEAFVDPAPWYRRGEAGWRRLCKEHGLDVHALWTPCWPDTDDPASLMFVTAAAYSGAWKSSTVVPGQRLG